MTLPRSALIDPGSTPYYHCVSRCVRRAFLCGEDPYTGYNFEHRRTWIENQLHNLAGIFDIDLCAYAVMSNHYHVVLRLGQAHARWSAEEVIARWSRLYRLPDGFAQAGEGLVAEKVALWRERLGSISWFMKCVNEPLARFANNEDGCKGRFWEGRFRSQALLDEAAVLKCMAYVDLNPVRARMADTPEESEHTSIKARIEQRDEALAPMFDRGEKGFCLPITMNDYVILVDWTGRQLRHDKRGAINARQPPIIERLAGSARSNSWLREMQSLTRQYCRAIGSKASMMRFRDRIGQRRLRGLVC